MEINVRRVWEVTVIEVSGRLTLLDAAEQLRQAVRDAVQSGHKHIVLNIARLSFVDSSCLGELVSCYITAARQGGTVKYADPPTRIQELLLVTRLNRILETYETEAAAIASFGVRQH
jgi:anti-anti-sigma factor